LAKGRGATRRVGRRGGKTEQAEKGNSGVEKRKDISPGDVRSGVKGSGRIEKNTSAKVEQRKRKK
jgi:hypothetical protein